MSVVTVQHLHVTFKPFGHTQACHTAKESGVEHPIPCRSACQRACGLACNTHAHMQDLYHGNPFTMGKANAQLFEGFALACTPAWLWPCAYGHAWPKHPLCSVSLISCQPLKYHNHGSRDRAVPESTAGELCQVPPLLSYLTTAAQPALSTQHTRTRVRAHTHAHTRTHAHTHTRTHTHAHARSGGWKCCECEAHHPRAGGQHNCCTKQLRPPVLCSGDGPLPKLLRPPAAKQLASSGEQLWLPTPCCGDGPLVSEPGPR